MPEEAALDPSWLSLLPAFVAIALAFLTRQVLVALFAGVVTASVVLFVETGRPGELNFIQRLLLPAIGSTTYAQILLVYLWSLGGLLGLWERTGAARHFAETIGGRIARGPRSSLLFGWLVGCLFHQGGTVSTVLAGTTVRPVTDRHRVSHEELSYVIDSTASPVATVIPLNVWPYYVGGLVAGTIPLIPDEASGVGFFLASLFPYNFYGLLAVTSTLLFSLGWLPWTGGRMRQARERARATGKLDGPGAEPLLATGLEMPRAAPGYRPALVDFLLPIGLLIGIAVTPYLLWAVPPLLGGTSWIARDNINWINEAFFTGALSAVVLARVRGLPLREGVEAFVHGCRGMTIGAIILGLAVTLGFAARELHTAAYLVDAVGALVSPLALPAILTVLCMGVAFATGTSFGTYAVVFPVALPLAYAVNPDPTYVQVCFGAILGGSVFGDQCSPISDTTILSSMFTGCDLMDHVRTQLPLALAAASLGAALSTAVVAFAG